MSKIWSPVPVCNIQTDIDQKLADYVKVRFQREQLVRIGIIPFDVPESFAQSGYESQNYGRELARRVLQNLVATGELPIVELFNRDRWPGKREEYFAGNYRSIEMARDAGYDIVIVGYLEEPKDDSKLTLHTKAIDASNGVSIWSAKTVVLSEARSFREGLAKVGIGQSRPDLFDFPERTEELAACTAKAMVGLDE